MSVTHQEQGTTLNNQKRVLSHTHQFGSCEEQINDTKKPLFYQTGMRNLKITCSLHLSYSLARFDQHSPKIKALALTQNYCKMQANSLSEEGWISKFYITTSETVRWMVDLALLKMHKQSLLILSLFICVSVAIRSSLSFAPTGSVPKALYSCKVTRICDRM